MKTLELKKIKKIHFVGIKGVAMTALAILVKEAGFRVSGSDTAEVFPTDETLGRHGIIPTIGFNQSVPAVDLVVYTGAHGGAGNPQIIEAQKKNIATLPHGKALALFTKTQSLIAVAGSHGKTTTSSIIAQTLMRMRQDPSFAVGCGEILSLKTSGHFGTGSYMVVEADEYVMDPQHDRTPRFLSLFPKYLLITNIDFDHPDVYPNIEAVEDAFVAFTQNIEKGGCVILNGDDPKSMVIKSRIKVPVLTYGTSANADMQLIDSVVNAQSQLLSLRYKGKILPPISISVPGRHNALNATGAVATLLTSGFSIEDIAPAIATFVGTKRRFEFIVQKNDKILIDDYAHHPTEIAATIAAARSWYPRERLIVVFQPHTFSRTRALLDDFARALAQSDVPILTAVYASAREKTEGGALAQELMVSLKSYNKSAIFAENEADVLQYIHRQTKPKDVIITMGAGSIYSWLTSIQNAL